MSAGRFFTENHVFHPDCANWVSLNPSASPIRHCNPRRPAPHINSPSAEARSRRCYLRGRWRHCHDVTARVGEPASERRLLH